MSLLIEPANQSACQRNKKEELLRMGLLKQKSQPEYLLKHIGLQARPRQPVTSSSGAALRAAARSMSGTHRKSKHAEAAPPGSTMPIARSPSVPSVGSASVTSWRSGRSGLNDDTRSEVGSRASEDFDEDDAEFQTAYTRAKVLRQLRKDMQDPVQAMVMKGPPLFSPTLCSMASYC